MATQDDKVTEVASHSEAQRAEDADTARETGKFLAEERRRQLRMVVDELQDQKALTHTHWEMAQKAQAAAAAAEQKMLLAEEQAREAEDRARRMATLAAAAWKADEAAPTILTCVKAQAGAAGAAGTGQEEGVRMTFGKVMTVEVADIHRLALAEARTESVEAGNAATAIFTAAEEADVRAERAVEARNSAVRYATPSEALAFTFAARMAATGAVEAWDRAMWAKARVEAAGSRLAAVEAREYEAWGNRVDKALHH